VNRKQYYMDFLKVLVASFLLNTAGAVESVAKDFRYVGDGRVEWNEDATEDSGVLFVRSFSKCSNTGVTSFTPYTATPTGQKLAIWLGSIPSGVACTPTNTLCNEVQLDPGYYVFDPDSIGASAFCVGGFK